MAAVRFLAKRLGGSLLQLTQAAVAEEGLQLVPSRLMRSRRLSSTSSKAAGETHKEHKLSDLESMREQQRAKMEELIKKYESFSKREPPDPTYLCIIRASDEVIKGAAKLAFFGLIILSFGDEGVEAQENQ